ncbi:hypothetical protein ACFWA5_40105 [Streptomyces mirabilis]|uniref:hypothetical protein n=1 Tax=Streptomyces mirabilis TaxID=68239 RepID=UPI00365F3890
MRFGPPSTPSSWLERMVPPGELLFQPRRARRHGRPQHRILALTRPAGPDRGIRHLGQRRSCPPRPARRGDPARPARSGRHPTLPPNPGLAQHIARHPGGLVALAIQYSHLRTALVSEGYAARSRDGIHEVRAVADLIDDLQVGGGLSGLAARRAIKTAAHAPRFEGTVINATAARRLRANDDALLYDNPQALLLCHYKRKHALCHRIGVRDSPRSITACPAAATSSEPTTVRTDHHATRLRDRADELDKQAVHVTQQISQRLHDHAERLRGIADTHDRTRITFKDATT